MNHPFPSIKVVFIGDSGVGKSSIIGRYGTGIYQEDILPTVGASFLSKIFPIDDSQVELRIWDTAGQERFESLAPIYFLNSKIAFVVFDITKRQTYENANKWISQLREYAGTDVITVIVANKVDLDTTRAVSKGEYTQLANDLGCLVAETSAVTGIGINEMFQESIMNLLENNNDFRYELSLNHSRSSSQKLQDTSCC